MMVLHTLQARFYARFEAS